MTDKNENELEINDVVIFNHHRIPIKGTVSHFTKKKVAVMSIVCNDLFCAYCNPQNISKINLLKS